MSDDGIAHIDQLDTELSKAAGKPVGRSEIIRALLTEALAKPQIIAAARRRILTSPRFVRR